MSFIKKAVKKIFKVVKKIVKSKIFMIIAIAAIIFFTAGVAAGGFAAFGGVNTIGGFFVAAGQTMATGASAIAGGLGMGGLSATLAGHGGAAAAAAGLAGAPIATASTTALAVGSGAYASGGGMTAALGGTASTTAGAVNVGAATVAGGTAGVAAGTAVPLAGSGFVATAGKVFGTKVLGDVTLGQMVTSAVVSGMSAVLSAKAGEQEFRNGFVAGDLARGGGTDTRGLTGFATGDPTETQAGVAETDEALAEGQPSVARQLASDIAGPETQTARRDTSIRGLIQERRDADIAGASPFTPQDQFAAQQQQEEEQPGDAAAVGQVGPGSRTFNDRPTRIAYNPTTPYDDRLFGGLAGV